MGRNAHVTSWQELAAAGVAGVVTTLGTHEMGSSERGTGLSPDTWRERERGELLGKVMDYFGLSDAPPYWGVSLQLPAGD